ncbi:MAG: PDZ domain-containing protein [Phycisphaerales bacterium]
MSTTARVMLMVAMVGAAAGISLGQQGGGKQLKSWAPNAGVPAVQNSTSTTRVRVHEGSEVYEITLADGKVEALHNGEPIPADRLRLIDGSVEILDENGELIKSLPVVTQTTAVGALPAYPQEPPKVMIGITMTNDGEEDGVVIAHVVEGLPADKAGLQVEDRIIKVGDEKVEDEIHFRSILRNHKPGDAVKVTVIREGKESTFDVTLEAFDGGRLGSPMVTTPGEAGQMRFLEDLPLTGLLNRGGPDLETLMESVRKSLESTKNLSEEDREKLGDKIEHALESAMENHAREMGEGRQRWMSRIQPRDNVLTTKPGVEGQGMTFAMPGSDGADVSKKLDKLMKKLDALEKRLDELSEKLGKPDAGR